MQSMMNIGVEKKTGLGWNALNKLETLDEVQMQDGSPQQDDIRVKTEAGKSRAIKKRTLNLIEVSKGKKLSIKSKLAIPPPSKLPAPHAPHSRHLSQSFLESKTLSTKTDTKSKTSDKALEIDVANPYNLQKN